MKGVMMTPVQRFDLSSAQWSGVSPVCADPEHIGTSLLVLLNGP